MSNATRSVGGGAGIGIGIAGSLVAAVIFVVLTAATGTTYHLFPLLIAFLPGGLPRVLSERPISRRESALASTVGFGLVLAVWLALELIDQMPSATLISDQPGGVAGEFVVVGLIGALIGAWWAARA